MNIQKLYKDFGIAFITGEDRIRGSRDGWVNVPCPHCSGNPGYHLGWNEDGGYFVCWRCGGNKKTIETLAAILHKPKQEITTILQRYKGKTIITRTKPIPKIRVDNFRLPKPLQGELTKPYLKYLESRNFDPEEIISKWRIQATGRTSLLDGINYKRRILIPVFWDNEIVTFQGRDITEKHPFKYLACPENRERISIKKVLYGRQADWGDVGICVEGATDVWRLGDLSFALFGIKYRPKQVRLIAKQFRRVFILFDPENIAMKQAKQLKAQLEFRGVETYIRNIGTDPADMSQSDAAAMVRELQTWKLK